MGAQDRGLCLQGRGLKIAFRGRNSHQGDYLRKTVLKITFLLVKIDAYCWHQNHYIQKNIFRGIHLCNVIDYIYIMKFSRELICVMS